MPNIHTFSKNFYLMNSFVLNLAVPGAVGAAGGSVDTLNYRRAAAILDCTTGGSGTTLAVKLQECATSNGTFTDVTSGNFVTVTASSTVYAILDIDLSKRLRYLQLYYTMGGTPTGYATGTFLLYEPYHTDIISQVTAAVSV